MIINYLGASFVKAQQGDLVVAFNPPSKEADAKVARFGADLALISMNNSVCNGRDTVTYANKMPFVVEGPGEYEIGGIFVRGFPSIGADGQINTVYTINLDNIKICFLGMISDPNLASEVVEEIGAVDILFVPIGGDNVLAPKGAGKLATSLEPKMIVPIMYNGSGEQLKLFLKEMGVSKETVVDKLTIKKKDLDGKEGEVVVIKSN